VQGADCAQEINGVCYTCPEDYPNNLFTNGECFCGKDNGDQVACIRSGGASVTDSVGSGVTQVVTSGSGMVATSVSVLFVVMLGVVGHMALGM